MRYSYRGDFIYFYSLSWQARGHARATWASRGLSWHLGMDKSGSVSVVPLMLRTVTALRGTHNTLTLDTHVYRIQVTAVENNRMSVRRR